ncbi:MAG: hypothetical protein ACI31G_03930 [Bacilli bacterium]
MKMNKKVVTCVLFTFLGLSLIGCSSPTNNSDSTSTSGQTSEKSSSINLKSASTQNLKIGEEMTIVYIVNGNKDVGFYSKDPSIATVDDYAGVRGISEGETDIRIYLLEDENDYVDVHFVVSKPFFLYEKGYYNGLVDFSKEDEGLVKAKGDQVQMLVNELGENWYFTVSLKRTGSANNDTVGRWGVGSFLVDKSHPIGNTMFWYGFRRPTSGKDSEVTSYYGGWRYAPGIVSEEYDIDPFVKDAKDGVDVTIIRKGKLHYFYWDTHEDKIIKCVQSVDGFDGVATYPGVYSQNQLLDITNFEASNDLEVVEQKLDEFQQVESIDINCIDNRLINNNTYQLTTSVYPEIAPNKNVTYSLYSDYEGISLTEDGLLTIGSGVTSEFRVTAVSKNNKNAKQTKKFVAINSPTSTGLINSMMIKAEDDTSLNVDTNNNTITFNYGDNYVPLNVKSKNWVASFNIKISQIISGKGEIGLLSSHLGYMQYYKFGLNLNSLSELRNFVCYELGGIDTNYLTYNRDNSDYLNTNISVTIVRKENLHYIIVNDKLLKSYETSLDESIPVIYANGVEATVSNITVTDGSVFTTSALAPYKFYTGGYVNKSGEVYDINTMDITGGDKNWPPMNDYVNGIKNVNALKGDFDIGCDISNLSPYGNNDLDSKILFYLKSEVTTASIQIVIKGTRSEPIYTLCINYDDATWDEYDLSSYNIDFSGTMKFKIEKRVDGCKLFINGISILDGDKALLNDNYDWSNQTIMTPGIGTFRLGMRVSSPYINVVE